MHAWAVTLLRSAGRVPRPQFFILHVVCLFLKNGVASSNKFRSSDLLNLDRSSRRSPAKSQSTASVEATRAAHGDHHDGGTDTPPGVYCPSDGSPPPL